ncbi:MAG: 1-phosphofructokinase [Anaerolineales bacterium]|nr:1-phosphofructokinase [Anaerolineales bacterium]
MIYTVTLNPAIDRELLVPEIEFDTVLRASKWQVDFGGKGFNVSRLLLGFDTPSVTLGFVGGESGKFLENGLHSLGIQTDFVRVEGETRTNVSIRSQAKSHYIKANEPGPTISAAGVQQLLAKITQLAAPDDWWVLAGSLPPGCPVNIYSQIITLIQSKGSHAILDTSGEALKLGCQAAPFLCKPNLHEAQTLTGLTNVDPREVAAAVLETGPANVVISLGEDGAVYSGAQGAFAIASPQIAEKNPIGAGDSMVGAMVWALAQGMDFEGVVRWGVACGAATASLEGTSVGDKQAAQTLLSQTMIN